MSPPDSAVTELWRDLSGVAPGRTDPAQITLFDSVGFAVEDFTALRFVRDAVQGTGFSEQTDLIAEPDDPKDLFGTVGAPVPVG